MVRRPAIVHNAQYKLALVGFQNLRIVMQRFVSNWLCVSTVFYKKTMEKKLIFFFSSSDLYI